MVRSKQYKPHMKERNELIMSLTYYYHVSVCR